MTESTEENLLAAIRSLAVREENPKLLPQLLTPHIETTPTLEPPDLSPTEALEWIFLLDTLNFCFWSDEPTLFTVSHAGRSWTGYQSLCAALARAVGDGIPIYKPGYYGNISEEKMRLIFRSDTHVDLPLLTSRRKNLLEAAQVLKEEFGGQVSELIRRSGKSAAKLVSLLVHYFPSYRDVGSYRGKEVAFLKRAQIFAADVWQQFGGEGLGEFADIDELTMFADYRVPQGLLQLQVLDYSAELMAALRAGEHLDPGGEWEAEIRGCSIWAVELIRRRMCRLLGEERKQNSAGGVVSAGGGVVNAAMIDFFLWHYTKSQASDMTAYPIHRTHTIFY